jgi:hypothetical protein
VTVAWTGLVPYSFGFRPEFLSRSGGATVNGAEQMIANPNMRWRAKGKIPIRNDADVLAARTLFATMQGAAEAVYVPAFDKRRAPWPDPFGSIVASLFSDYDARTNQITIHVTTGGALLPGQRFSVHGHLHQIVSNVAHVGANWTVKIMPGLRSASASSLTVEFEDPTCPMKLINDDQVQEELELLRFDDLMLEFREDI